MFTFNRNHISALNTISDGADLTVIPVSAKDGECEYLVIRPEDGRRWLLSEEGEATELMAAETSKVEAPQVDPVS